MPNLTPNITLGFGYRVCTSDRPLAETVAPDGFVVLNTTDNNVYMASGGVWILQGTFPTANFTQAMYDEWLLS